MGYQTVKADWLQRGFGCELWTDPPGQVWKDYIHETDELLMLVEGEIELTFAAKTIRPKIGEEILIPAQTLHTVKNIGDVVNSWYYGYKNG